MERVIVTISSDLFDDMNQEASLRGNISARTVIMEIQREFNLPEGNYALRIKGKSKPLDLDRTMEQLGIQTGAELQFTRERRSAAKAAAALGTSHRLLSGPKQAYLREDSTGKLFELEWQPAIIGRPDANNPVSGEALAVNLSGFEESRSVSRQHASITERNGVFFIESMAERNLAELNGSVLQIGERRSLQHGDKILIGKIALTFKFRGMTDVTTLPEPENN
jgi:hypothetical protein